MYNVTRFCKILMVLLCLCSCAKGRYSDPSDMFKAQLEDATPDFRQGWLDGCESGMASGSNSFNQMFYKNNKVDGYKMSYSPDYSTAWSNAWWYCMRKDWTNQRSTIWGSIFQGWK